MKNSTIRCFIHKDINNNFIISSKRKIDNYTQVILNYIKENSPNAYKGFTRIFLCLMLRNMKICYHVIIENILKMVVI
jgi:hypothetical protein